MKEKNDAASKMADKVTRSSEWMKEKGNKAKSRKWRLHYLFVVAFGKYFQQTSMFGNQF